MQTRERKAGRQPWKVRRQDDMGQKCTQHRQPRHGRSYRWGGLAGKQAQQTGKGNMRHITQHNARKARDGSAGQENAR